MARSWSRYAACDLPTCNTEVSLQAELGGKGHDIHVASQRSAISLYGPWFCIADPHMHWIDDTDLREFMLTMRRQSHIALPSAKRSVS
jgi:hypothetical protein